MKSALNLEMLATDLAYYLVKKGVSGWLIRIDIKFKFNVNVFVSRFPFVKLTVWLAR